MSDFCFSFTCTVNGITHRVECVDGHIKSKNCYKTWFGYLLPNGKVFDHDTNNLIPAKSHPLVTGKLATIVGLPADLVGPYLASYSAENSDKAIVEICGLTVLQHAHEARALVFDKDFGMNWEIRYNRMSDDIVRHVPGWVSKRFLWEYLRSCNNITDFAESPTVSEQKHGWAVKYNGRIQAVDFRVYNMIRQRECDDLRLDPETHAVLDLFLHVPPTDQTLVMPKVIVTKTDAERIVKSLLSYNRGSE